jgi:hypothetical protein
MKIRRKVSYESQRPNLGREYCVKLVKLRLLLEAAQGRARRTLENRP